MEAIHGQALAEWALGEARRFQQARLPKGPGGRPSSYRDSSILGSSMFQKTTTHLFHFVNLFILIISLSYAVWFVSYGEFPEFNPLYNHFSELGQAFLKGQVYLLQEPSPELRNLADPHDAVGSDIPFLWDASYYQGKYYVYWGPVPATYYMIWTAITHKSAPDQLGILLPFAGIGITWTIFLYLLRKHYFPNAPLLSIGLFTIIATLNPPFLQLLSRPMVYEISILSGQFFLLLSIFFIFLFILKRARWLLFISGIMMGLAILSRYNLLISVVIEVLFVASFLWFSRKDRKIVIWKQKHLCLTFLSLVIPLFLSSIFLFWYNSVRFDNPFETGIRYQLTNPVPGSRYYAPQFIATNAYLYLFKPVSWTLTFPFVKVEPFDLNSLPAWAAAKPGKQFDPDFFGLLHSSPVFGFGIICLFGLAFLIKKQEKNRTKNFLPERFSIHFFTWMALITGISQMAFLMIYYYSALRFSSDYFLLFMLAFVFIWWDLDQRISSVKVYRIFFWGILSYLVIQTSLIGIFSGFSIHPYLFLLNNPELYNQISGKFLSTQKFFLAFLNPLLALRRIITLLL